MARKTLVIRFLVAAAPLIGALLPGSPATAGPHTSGSRGTGIPPLCWRYFPSPNGVTGLSNYLFGVDGISSNDVWAVGLDQGVFPNEALIEHWDGTAWGVNAQINIGSGGTALYAVLAISSTDVWAVGYYNGNLPLIEHWDGTGWFISPTPVPGVSHTLFSVVAASPTDVWAVGDYRVTSDGPTQTLTFHWDGGNWTQVHTPSPGAAGNQLGSVDVVSSTDVWAVGIYTDANNNGYTLTEHWNGAKWSVVPSPTASNTALVGVSAISSNDVWAVGSGTSNFSGFSIHWDGTRWTQFTMPLAGVEDYLHGVDALSSNDVWAVGEASPNYETWQALALHWTGSRWSLVSAVSGNEDAHFYAVADLSRGHAWAVGSGVPGGGQTSTLTEHTTAC